MSEKRRTVFISCGQYTDEERALGELTRKLVDELTPFEGYFAQNQVSLKTLSENVLTRLYDSVGLIAIMHHRGLVTHKQGIDGASAGPKHIRASVWVEQEIAIAALMEQVLRRPLHVALFTEHGIEVEGIRKQLHLNPVQFANGDEVINRLREILPTWKEPLYMTEDQQRKLSKKFVPAEPKEGQARFRLKDQSLGVYWDSLLSGNEYEVFLASGSAIWLRLMPITTPEQTWTTIELRKRAPEPLRTRVRGARECLRRRALRAE
ncbi:MAG: hypothetical protein WBD73_00625 [Candidatus Acidiferrales bacterium]